KTVKRPRQADLSKVISQEWKRLSIDERRYWEELAKERKQAHERAFPDYSYSPRKPAASRNEVKWTLQKHDDDLSSHKREVGDTRERQQHIHGSAPPIRRLEEKHAVEFGRVHVPIVNFDNIKLEEYQAAKTPPTPPSVAPTTTHAGVSHAEEDNTYTLPTSFYQTPLPPPQEDCFWGYGHPAASFSDIPLYGAPPVASNNPEYCDTYSPQAPMFEKQMTISPAELGFFEEFEGGNFASLFATGEELLNSNNYGQGQNIPPY
ncbi:hypothetical protein DL96DRAFT_1631581, partial [Flagelloscypha sp. PMI_526]